MNTLSHALIAQVGGTTARPDFWGTGVGSLISGFLFVLGILVVLGAIIKGFGHIAKGDVGKAVKLALGAAVLAAFLFQPSLIETLIDTFGKMITIVIEGIGDISDQSGGA